MIAHEHAEQLIAGLEAAGITLEVVNGRRVRLTHHDRLLTTVQAAQLSSLKADVIRLLLARGADHPVVDRGSEDVAGVRHRQHTPAAARENGPAVPLRVFPPEQREANWPPRDPRLARWPIPLRAAWGRRANELIDRGLGWQAAERQSFVEVLRRQRPDDVAVPARFPLMIGRNFGRFVQVRSTQFACQAFLPLVEDDDDERR